MISFASDYVAGAHPKVLNKLIETNMEILSGYGSDKYCLSAAEKIKKACACPDADVRFLVGGTQTNQIIIDTMLDSHEGVIAGTTGHISAHEAGAVEYTGHKVITIPCENGKIKAADVKSTLKNFYEDDSYEHMVFPGMVYISFPTEYGTIYKKSELEQIYYVCKEYEIPLFIDGARLGYGLASDECDITLEDLVTLCDVFYLKISRDAIILAGKIEEIFAEKGYSFFIESPTNQQFIILDNKKLEEISSKVNISIWEKYDNTHTVVRFATSWSTTEEDLEYLKGIL